MKDVIEELYSVILERKECCEEGSYTSYLFEKGKDKILKKVGEECTEVIISCKDDNKEEKVNEICDLAYHLLVLMAEEGISLEEINQELTKRSSKIGNLKVERRKIEKI